MRVLTLCLFACLATGALAQNAGELSTPEIWKLAEQLDTQQDPEGAMKLFEHLANRKELSRDMKASAILRQADCLLELEKPASARACYESVVKDFADLKESVAAAKDSLATIKADATDREASILDGKTLTAAVDAMNPREFARILAVNLQLPVVVDAGSDIFETLEVTTSVKVKDARQALRGISSETGTVFVERAGFLVWTTRGRAAQLRKRPAAQDLTSTKDEDQAELAKARRIQVAGDLLNLSGQKFLDRMKNCCGIDIDANNLPEAPVGAFLACQAQVLELVDIIAFEYDLQLSVKGGRMTLRINSGK